MAGLRMSAAMWDALRREYASGTAAKALAQRYPISVSRIYGRASTERWREISIQSGIKERQ